MSVFAWNGVHIFYYLEVLTWTDFPLAYSWLQSDEVVTPGAKPPGYPCQWSLSKKAGRAWNSRFLHKSQHSAIQRILPNVPSRARRDRNTTCDDKGSEFKWTFLTKPHIIVACTTKRDDLLVAFFVSYILCHTFQFSKKIAPIFCVIHIVPYTFLQWVFLSYTS